MKEVNQFSKKMDEIWKEFESVAQEKVANKHRFSSSVALNIANTM